MKHVLCFGDSNTWGYIPGQGRRYDEHTRWTGVLAQALGPDWCVHEDGLNARTTVHDSPFKPFLNGLAALPVALWAQKPIDVLVLSLGTNDLKTHTAAQAAAGVASLVTCAQTMDARYPSGQPVFTNGPKILVISPIAVGEGLEVMNPDDELGGKYAQSLLFPEKFAAMCAGLGVELLDAQQYAQPSASDGVHMTPEGHRALGLAVAGRVRDMA